MEVFINEYKALKAEGEGIVWTLTKANSKAFFDGVAIWLIGTISDIKERARVGTNYGAFLDRSISEKSQVSMRLTG